MIHYTRGKNRLDAHPEPRSAESFIDFAAAVLMDRTPLPKDRAPYWARDFATDADGVPKRCSEGALPAPFVALDVDHLAVAAAPTLMARVATRSAFWYASHSATDAVLKRRIVFELDRPATVQEHPLVVDAIEQWLGAGLGDNVRFDSPVARDPARLWFVPPVGGDSGIFEGAAINVARAVAAARPPSLEAPEVVPGHRRTRDELREIILRGVPGEVYNALISLSARLAGAGMAASDIADTLRDLLDACAWRETDPATWQERWNAAPMMAASAARKFGDHPPAPVGPILAAPLTEAPADVFSAPSPAPVDLDPAYEPENGPLAAPAAAEAVSTPPAAPRAPERSLPAFLVYAESEVGRLYMERHGADTRFVPALKAWAYWEGATWRIGSHHPESAMQDACRDFAMHAINDPAVARPGIPAMSLARRVMSNAFISGVIRAASRDSRFVAEPGAFDASPFLLNCPSAMYDLRDGSVVTDRREQLPSKCTAVDPNHDPQAFENSRFRRFLQEITGGDRALEQFLQRSLGACLFGVTAVSDHWLLFFVGGGRNGKSVLIEAAAHAMGTYASKVSAELLMARAHSEHPTEIAYLRGLRLAFAAELNEGARWNEARIKEATGDSTLQARVMHGNFFTFTPTHRFVIAANSRPSISTPDQALRSRLRMVPFLQNFAGREDTHLPRTIRGEAAIVLGWLIRGAEAFYEAGELRNCAAVAEQTEEYFEAHSILDHWIEERCMLDPEAFTPTRELYADFRRWKETRGEGVPSETRFGEQLGRHAALQKRRVNSIRGVQGVKLSPTRPDLLGSRNSGY